MIATVLGVNQKDDTSHDKVSRLEDESCQDVRVYVPEKSKSHQNPKM